MTNYQRKERLLLTSQRRNITHTLVFRTKTQHAHGAELTTLFCISSLFSPSSFKQIQTNCQQFSFCGQFTQTIPQSFRNFLLVARSTNSFSNNVRKEVLTYLSSNLAICSASMIFVVIWLPCLIRMAKVCRLAAQPKFGSVDPDDPSLHLKCCYCVHEVDRWDTVKSTQCIFFHRKRERSTPIFLCTEQSWCGGFLRSSQMCANECSLFFA